jgi:hypothetical protein
MSNQNTNSFFQPLWRRWAILAATAFWAAYEILVSKDQLWMMISLAMVVYGYFSLIRNWPEPKKESPPPQE